MGSSFNLAPEVMWQSLNWCMVSSSVALNDILSRSVSELSDGSNMIIFIFKLIWSLAKSKDQHKLALQGNVEDFLNYSIYVANDEWPLLLIVSLNIDKIFKNFPLFKMSFIDTMISTQKKGIKTSIISRKLRKFQKV